jgi:hypothetical protein
MHRRECLSEASEGISKREKRKREKAEEARVFGASTGLSERVSRIPTRDASNSLGTI